MSDGVIGRARAIVSRWLIVRRHRFVAVDVRAAAGFDVPRYEVAGRSLGRGIHLLHIDPERAPFVEGARLYAVSPAGRRLVHEIPGTELSHPATRLAELPAGTRVLEVHGGPQVAGAPFRDLRATRLGRIPLTAVLAGRWVERRRRRGIRQLVTDGASELVASARQDGAAGVVDRLVRSQAHAQRRPPVTDGTDGSRPTVHDADAERAAAEQARAAHSARSAEELERFLSSGDRLDLTPAGHPRLTVALVLHNRAELTYACMRSLADHGRGGIEVVVVDNASSDRTGELLSRLDGAVVIRNSVNEHFVRGANLAAAHASADLLVQLNNDAVVTPGCLDAITAAFSDPGVGVVGGLVVSPWGAVLEAGGILWSDGSTAPYGRELPADDPAIDFVRDVPYVTGCVLATRTALWRALGGFDEDFAPAYYEDVDYCLRVRDAGYVVRYDPDVRVVHVERASAASEDWVSERIRTNRSVLAGKHPAVLATSPDPMVRDTVRARSIDRGARRVLVLDDRIPFSHHGAGSPRTRALLEVLDAAGVEVTFAVTHPPDDPGAVRSVVPRRTEVVVVRSARHVHDLLEERTGFYDDLVVSRPHNMELLRAGRGQLGSWRRTTRLVYDAEAVTALRSLAAARLARTASEDEPHDDLEALERELALADDVDLVLAVSRREAAMFESRGLPAKVVSHGVTVRPTLSSFDERDGLLFVGNLAHLGSPNVDALVHFVDDVLPLVRAEIGTVTVRVAGAVAPQLGRRLSEAGVEVLGVVDDLVPLYDRARAFIAPTRFAAGIPLKVVEAAAHGLPVAVTSLLAEQLDWHQQALVHAPTGDARRLADACSTLLTDHRSWELVRAKALEEVVNRHTPEVFTTSVYDALGLVPTHEPSPT